MRKFFTLLFIGAICFCFTVCSILQSNVDLDAKEEQDNNEFNTINQTIEQSSEDKTIYSKYPANLNTYNLNEIGDFVVLYDNNDKIDYDGFNYVFSSPVVFNGTYSSIKDVQVYSVYNNNIIVINSNLEVVTTAEFNDITDKIFNTYNGWGDAVTLSIDNYNNETGEFNLLNNEKKVLCVPYDSIDWENCYTITYGHLNSSAAVAVLK